jgi:hypothetical protein
MRSYPSFLALALVLSAVSPAWAQVDYLTVATTKTSTAEKEMNEAAADGFRFAGVMGGETAFGGAEVVTVMHRTPEAVPGRYAYRLLAANRTSTMQRELQQAADAGYEYRGQTIFNSLFGGREVVVILERDGQAEGRLTFDYLLVATSKTSTLQKELKEAGAAGYEFVGLTVGQTALGGSELVAILRKPRS